MNEHDIACLLSDMKDAAAEAYTANLIAFYAALDPHLQTTLRSALHKQILDRLGVYE